MPPRPIVPAGLLSRPACSGRAMSLALRLAATPALASPTAAAARPFAAPASRSLHSSRKTNSDKPQSQEEELVSDADKPLAVPPESPKYIKVPTPPQSQDHRGATHRGHLPVPRDIFNFRKEYAPSHGTPKSDTAAWAEAATPLSKAELNGEEPKNELEAWRRRMAATRRQSLEEGLSGLWKRREGRERRAHARAARTIEAHRQAGKASHERTDELLTQSTMLRVTEENTKVVRDPLRHERQAEMALRTEAKAAAKRDARRDALMELYQAAGKFIVDEEGLRQRVDQLFRPDYFKDEGYSYGTVNAENIWDVAGKPSTVQEMMTNITRTETKLYDSKRTEADRTAKRQKLVTEALTGGKMPV